MRRFILLLLTVTFSFGLSTSETAYGKDKKKSSAAEPFKTLSFEQVARLHHTQRLKYVKALRKSARDLEQMQFVFRNSRKTASLEQLNEENSMYALLLGWPAYAQGEPAEPVGDSGDRGRTVSAQCIFGYNISTYPTRDPNPKTRQPFECKRPADAQCGEGGVVCGAFLSGLSQAHDSRINRCVQRGSRHIATSICDDKRKNLADSVGKNGDVGLGIPNINDAIADSNKYFGFKEPGAKINVSDMTNAEAEKVLNNLLYHAYDDRAYAQLIYVLGLYKKGGVKPPTVGVGKIYNELSNPTAFEKNFNEIQSAINGVFKDYLAHCNSPVPQAEIDELLNPRWAAKYNHCNGDLENKSPTPCDLEKQRIEAAEAHRAGQKAATVENITEIHECRAIKARVNGIKKALNQPVASYPDIDGRPINPNPPAATEPVVTQPNPANYGCSTNYTADEHQLYQNAAKCMACMANSAITQADNLGKTAEEKSTIQSYSVSTPWLSFLSVMALACNDGGTGKYLTVETMDRYRQIFGHCSEETYDWNDSEPLTDEDKEMIKMWANNDMWQGKKSWSKTEPDREKAFSRIFGISYNDATLMMCNRDYYNISKSLGGKQRVLKRKSEEQIDKIRYKAKEKNADLDSPAYRRKLYTDCLNGSDSACKVGVQKISGPLRTKGKGNSPLLECMKDSQKTAEKYYSGLGKGSSCTNASNVGNLDNFKKMTDAVQAGGGAIIFERSSKHCYVAADILTNPKNENNKIIRFATPTDTKDPSRTLDFDFKVGSSASIKLAQASGPLDQRICDSTRTESCTDVKHYDFLYPNAGICSQASTPVPTGKAKGRNQ